LCGTECINECRKWWSGELVDNTL